MTLVLLRLIGLYAGLSVRPSAAVTVLSPQHAAVHRHHWLSAGDFLDIFAISRAAPGPGSLIGVKAAGMAGAAVSFAAIFAPSRLACMWSPRYWGRPPGSLGGWCWSALWPDRRRPDLRPRPSP
jgi:chromate transporter